MEILLWVYGVLGYLVIALLVKVELFIWARRYNTPSKMKKRLLIISAIFWIIYVPCLPFVSLWLCVKNIFNDTGA